MYTIAFLSVLIKPSINESPLITPLAPKGFDKIVLSYTFTINEIKATRNPYLMVILKIDVSIFKS